MTPTRRAHRALCTTIIAALAALLLTPAAHAAPTARDGACTGNEGVTVMVDLNPTSDAQPAQPVLMRCVLGAPANGFEALLATGFDVDYEMHPTWGPMISGIEGVSVTDPMAQWWSYFENDGTDWVDPGEGAASHVPRPGDVEGWRLTDDFAWPAPGPRATPNLVTITPADATFRAGEDVTIRFTLSAPVASTRCRINDGWWTSCTSATSHVIRAAVAGTHVIRVRATEANGISTTTQHTFRVAAADAAILGTGHARVRAHEALVEARVAAGGATQQVHVEYVAGDDHASAVRTAPQQLDAGTTGTLEFRLQGLTARTRFSYRVVSSGASGTTASAWRTLTTRRPAARLRVQAARRTVVRGRLVLLDVSRLDANERVRVYLHGRRLASRIASIDGRRRLAVRIPRSTRTGRAILRVTGAQANRNAHVVLRIRAPR